MQNNQKIIAIFGGGGFIGKHLIRNLTKLDYRIKIATRNPYLKGYLKPLGNPGQIELFQTNIFNEEDVKNVLKNCDLAINLVGILYETRKQKFNYIHSYFPYLLSNLCNKLGIKNLVHISALGVKEKHKSLYIQSKLEGEKNIQDNFKASVILRPSLVFGPEDKFFNAFASLAQFSPILPLIGGGKTKFAPIYVGDVAKAIVKALELNKSELTKLSTFSKSLTFLPGSKFFGHPMLSLNENFTDTAIKLSRTLLESPIQQIFNFEIGFFFISSVVNTSDNT